MKVELWGAGEMAMDLERSGGGSGQGTGGGRGQEVGSGREQGAGGGRREGR